MHTIRVFIISLLAILSFSSSCYANDDFPPGKYKIDITTGGGRPSSPYPLWKIITGNLRNMEPDLHLRFQSLDII